MKQYEKATAPRNRNRRNGPCGSARASRDLLRHPNRAGLSSSASGLRGAAGLCSARVCGPGPEADLPAGSGRASAGLLRPANAGLLRPASAGLLRPATGGLLRIPQPRLEASASAPRALRALLLSSLTIKPGEHGVVERRQTQKKRGIAGRGSKRIRAFSLGKFFAAKARSRLQLASNPVIVSGSKRLCRHS